MSNDTEPPVVVGDGVTDDTAAIQWYLDRAMTLTGFLLARIAEDEEAARRVFTTMPERRPLTDLMHHTYEHINRWDVTRVLAECEAKRRIVALHGESVAEDDALDKWDNEQGWVVDAQLRVLAAALRALAAVYADHADYREEWRP